MAALDNSIDNMILSFFSSLSSCTCILGLLCLCFCVKSGSYHDFNVYIVNDTASFVFVIYLSEHFSNIVISILHTVTVYKQSTFTIEGMSLFVTLKNMLHTFTINLCVLIFHALASVGLKRP